MGANLKGWLVGGLLLGTMAYAIAEEITLTTYYPSPRGVYQELKTAGDLVVGDITNPPAARLHVVGSGSAPALRVDNVPGGTSPVLVDASGNVGIGTESPGPAAKLEVAGLIHSTSGGFRFPDNSTQTTAVEWVMFDGGIQKVNSGSLTVFTPVSIASDTGDDKAKFAILSVRISITVSTGPGYPPPYAQLISQFRRGGSAAVANLPRAQVEAGHEHNPGTLRVANATMVIVPLSASETFEYNLIYSGNPTVISRELEIDLVGYIK